MKKFHFICMFLVTMFVASNENALAVPIEPCLDLGIFSNTANGNKLDIKVRPTITITGANYSAGTFVVKYPTIYNVALSIVPLLPPDVEWGYSDYFPNNLQTDGGYTYYVFYFATSHINQTWPANVERMLAKLQITSIGPPPPGGMGTFTLVAYGDDPFADGITGGSPFYQEMVIGNDDPGGGQQRLFYSNNISAPLPIELTKFNATAQPDQTVKLDWESALELNLFYYDVEHSTDGQKFNPIGKVAAKGTQNGPGIYGFNHNRPTSDDNYYRLKMVDIDGAFAYSPVRLVRFDDPGGNFRLSPNPTSGPFSLISSNLDHYKEDLRYQIFDVTGKLIEEGLVKDERLDFDLSKYKSGMYSFAILSNKEFIKQFQLILTTH